VITISLENVHEDDLQIAAKLFKVIQESQPSVKERLGFGPSETKKTQDFYSELASSIASKISKKIFKMDFTPIGFYPSSGSRVRGHAFARVCFNDSPI